MFLAASQANQRLQTSLLMDGIVQNGNSGVEDVSLMRALSDLYPATARWIYLDSVSRGLLPVTARHRAIEVLDSQLAASFMEEQWRSMPQLCLARFADLIGAQIQDVRFTRSFADGLGAIASVLQPRTGGNMVLCTALSSPDFISFWREFAIRNDLQLRDVPANETFGINTQDVDRIMDGETVLVAMPAVLHVRGLRMPLAEISDVCRGRGVFFLVDGTASVGVLQTRVARDGIDGVVVAADRNLLGLHGLGFVHVSSRWLKHLPAAQRIRAGFGGKAGPPDSNDEQFAGVLPGKAHTHDFEDTDLVSVVTAYEALGVLLDCGLERIERHVLGLAERLRTQLGELGMAVERPPADRYLSHIVAVGKPYSVAEGVLPDAGLRRFAGQLAAGRVRHSVRNGQLQFGFHLYNNLRDVMDVRRIAAQSLTMG